MYFSVGLIIVFSVIVAYACLAVSPPDDIDDMCNEVNIHEDI